MESKFMGAILTFAVYVAAALSQAVGNLDLWGIVDKYGFPTAALVVVVTFLWNRQRIADRERNALIEKNNELTKELIQTVKVGNACKFIGGK